MKKTTSKIRTDFTSDSDPDFLTRTNLIKSCIEGNPNYFPKPEPDMATLGAAIDAYKNALNLAGDLGKNNVKLKNVTRAALAQLIFKLGMYVMWVANGDETILIASGFPPMKPKEPIKLGPIGDVTLKPGINKGELLAKIKWPKGGHGNTFQITDEQPTNATVWVNHLCTMSKYLFTALVSGKEYWVRVIVAGGNGQVVYSTIANMFVL